MNTDKIQKDKSQLTSAANAQQQSESKSNFQYEDNRPEAIAQRKLQELANNRKTPTPVTQMQSNVIQLEKIKVTNLTLAAWDVRVAAIVGNLFNASGIVKAQLTALQRELDALGFAMKENKAPDFLGVQVSNGKTSTRTVFKNIETNARNHLTAGNRNYKAFTVNLKHYEDLSLTLEQKNNSLFINDKKVAVVQEPETHNIPLPAVNLDQFEKGVKRRIAELFISLAGIGGHPAQIQQNITQLVTFISTPAAAATNATVVLAGIKQALISAGKAAAFDYPKQTYNFGVSVLGIQKTGGEFIQS